MVTDGDAVPAGQAVVGAVLAPGAYPTAALRPGDPVQLVEAAAVRRGAAAPRELGRGAGLGHHHTRRSRARRGCSSRCWSRRTGRRQPRTPPPASSSGWCSSGVGRDLGVAGGKGAPGATTLAVLLAWCWPDRESDPRRASRPTPREVCWRPAWHDALGLTHEPGLAVAGGGSRRLGRGAPAPARAGARRRRRAGGRSARAGVRPRPACARSASPRPSAIGRAEVNVRRRLRSAAPEQPGPAVGVGGRARRCSSSGPAWTRSSRSRPWPSGSRRSGVALGLVCVGTARSTRSRWPSRPGCRCCGVVPDDPAAAAAVIAARTGRSAPAPVPDWSGPSGGSPRRSRAEMAAAPRTARRRSPRSRPAGACADDGRAGRAGPRRGDDRAQPLVERQACAARRRRSSRPRGSACSRWRWRRLRRAAAGRGAGTARRRRGGGRGRRRPGPPPRLRPARPAAGRPDDREPARQRLRPGLHHPRRRRRERGPCSWRPPTPSWSSSSAGSPPTAAGPSAGSTTPGRSSTSGCPTAHACPRSCRSSGRPSLSVRRHRHTDDRARPTSWGSARSTTTWPRSWRAAVRRPHPLNIVVAGGTDAGKTTFLRALLAEIEPCGAAGRDRGRAGAPARAGSRAASRRRRAGDPRGQRRGRGRDHHAASWPGTRCAWPPTG